MSEYDPKIRQLPGRRLTPDTVLGRTLDKKARIKAVAIVIQWDDDTFDTDWSLMTVSDLLYATRTLQLKVDSMIRCDPGADENLFTPPDAS